MWKLLLLTLYTLNCCWAGPVILKRNMPIKQQTENLPLNENINSPNDMKIYEEQQQKRENSRLQSKMMKMQTLNLPSNATSIRSNIIEGFSCQNRTYGYYADIENDCQIFHVCLPVKYANGKESIFRWSFICPEETVFSQDSFICMRPDDMTITCEESYQYYALNRNFGIIDNVMDMDKDVDNTITPNLSESVEQSGQIGHDGTAGQVEQYETSDQYDGNLNNKPVKQPVHRPNRPKPNSSFTFMHNRPKISTHPLRKNPTAIQTDEVITDNHDNSALILQQAEEEEIIKPSTQRYTKRPILNISKEKISSNKIEDKAIPKLGIYNSKRKRPAFFNNKKLASPTSTISTPIHTSVIENSELTINDKDEHNFFKTEAESKPDMSNKYLETEMADTDSQSSEKKIIFIKPEEQIKTDNILSQTIVEKSENVEKTGVTSNSGAQEKETIKSEIVDIKDTNILNELKQSEEVPLKSIDETSPDVEKESDHSQTHYVEEVPLNNEKFDHTNIAIIEPDIINVNNTPFIVGNDEVESTHALEHISEEISEGDKYIENSELDKIDTTIGNNQKLFTNQDKGSGEDSHMKVISDETSDEVATESFPGSNQPIEEMEAEKPLGAPESVPASDDMLQQSASIQEMFGEFRPTNSIEAEKLIVDFINKLSNTEENRSVVPFEVDNDALNTKLNKTEKLMDSKENNPVYKDSEEDITNKGLSQEEVKIFSKEDSENAEVSLERDTSDVMSKVFPVKDATVSENSGISDDQMPTYAESINKYKSENPKDKFNVKSILPLNEPQIAKENVRINDATEPEKNVLSNSERYDNAATISFDHVVQMVKDRLEYIPQLQNDMNHDYQKMPLTNENVNKSGMDKYGVEEDKQSDIIQANTEEYIIPIYHRVINNNEPNSESPVQKDSDHEDDVSDTLAS